MTLRKQVNNSIIYYNIEYGLEKVNRYMNI